MTDSFGEGESGSVMIIDYLKGSDLQKHFEKEIKAGNSFSKKEILGWQQQMCIAIKYLHTEAFTIHRDLHCGNWMLIEDGTLKLIDFGLALKLGKNGISADSW
jgi:serine/threonine-protein kinase